MRYRDEALRELYEIERKIKSNRKSAATTLNRKTAAIADATLPSLERKAAALREEINVLTDRPARQALSGLSDIIARFDNADPSKVHHIPTWPNGVYDETLLDIPAFLRRKPAAKATKLAA